MSELTKPDEVEVVEIEGQEDDEKKRKIPKINLEPLREYAGKAWELTKKHGPVYAAKTADFTGKSLVSVSEAADKVGGKIPGLSPWALSVITVVIFYVVWSLGYDTVYLITHADYLSSYFLHQWPLALGLVAIAMSTWKKKAENNKDETK